MGARKETVTITIPSDAGHHLLIALTNALGGGGDKKKKKKKGKPKPKPKS